ncbi:MAG: methyl-accepting chemotaxis protein [Fimbriimonadaceae bacterium]|jgi:methyl-accepting chemotaxis protein|nr:methyl-accepting chemotaxis protein [Fimbriimonadaceae bacterium]
MTWFYNLKTRSKLLLGFGVLIALTFVIAAVGFLALGSSRQSMTTFYDDVLPEIQTLKDITAKINEFRLQHYRAVATIVPEQRAKSLEKIKELDLEIDKLIDDYLEMAHKKDQENAVKLDEAWHKYRKRDADWMALVTSGKIEESKEHIETQLLPVARDEINPALAQGLKTSLALGARVYSSTVSQSIAAQRNMAIVFGVVLILCLTVTIVIVRYLTGVLKEISDRIKLMSTHGVPMLQEAMDGMASFDLTKQVGWKTQEIPRLYGDDLGEVGGNLNRLIVLLRATSEKYTQVQQNLLGIVKDLQAGAKQISDSCESLHSASEQASNASGEIAEGSEKLAYSAQETTAVMDRLLTGTEEVKEASSQQSEALTKANEDLGEASSVARDVAAAAQQATAVAQEGKLKIQSIVQANSKIEVQVEESTNQVRQLDEASGEIVAIVQSIEQIAEQTNLLALNAAIEAARAGEHGRGFAVVAEEVRKLAEQARGSTQQIVVMIDNIRKQVSQTVDAITATGPLVQHASKMSAEAGDSLGLIAESSEQVAREAHGVAQRSEELRKEIGNVQALAEQTLQQSAEMASGASQVSGAIQGVAAISEETAAGAEQLTASAQGVSDSVRQLSEMANKLSALASQFKTTHESEPDHRPTSRAA